MTYSVDFRKKVFKIKAEKQLNYEETAKYFNIGKTTLVRWNNRLEPKLTREKGATKIDMENLKIDVGLYPDAYQYERAERFGVSQRGIALALKRLGISYKKKFRTPKSQQGRTRYYS
jgi:transposase